MMTSWFHRTYSRGHYVEVAILPMLAVKYVTLNHSLHVSGAWLLWEGQLNIFFPKTKPEES